jgi:hypothetical protein
MRFAGCFIKLACHKNEDKLICRLANKTILANKLIFNVGISMFAWIRLSWQIAAICEDSLIRAK